MKVYIQIGEAYSWVEIRDELVATKPDNFERSKLIAELSVINIAVILDALDAGRPPPTPAAEPKP